MLTNDDVFVQFDEIEKKVESLIGTCRSLKTANAELNNKIERLEQEAKENNTSDKGCIEQRDVVRSKIDALLTKLNKYSESEPL